MSRFQPTLVIRADAGPTIGGGHIMRCWAIAQQWQRGGGKVLFVCGELPDSLRSRLAKSDCGVEMMNQAIGSTSDADLLAQIARDSNADWIVIDGYSFSIEYQRRVSSIAKRVLLISDDDQPTIVTASAVLNPNIFARRAVYQAGDAELWLGSEFALLREEFRKFASKSDDLRLEVRRILVTMGSADQHDVTSRVLDAINSLRRKDLEIDVVIGGCNEHNLQTRETTGDSKIHWHYNVSDMASLMQQADLAVAAGGSTCYELAAAGVPSLIVTIAENQFPLAAELHRLQAAVCIGRHSEIDNHQLASGIREFLNDASLRQILSQNASQLVDGLGASRVVRRMFQKLIRLRAVQRDDALRLYQWQQDSQVRSWSFTPGPSNFAQHQLWLERKLADPECRLLISETESGTEFGLVRLDLVDDHAVVGLALDSQYRGCRLAPVVLAAALEQFAKKHSGREVVAFIKPDNVASQRTFASEGFEFARNEFVQGQPAERWVWRSNGAKTKIHLKIGGEVNSMINNSTIEISGRKIGTGQPTYVIAELSANHDQRFESAIELVYSAKAAGADAVKLQTYKPETITIDCDASPFRIVGGTLWDGQTLFELYRAAYMPWEWQPKLMQAARDIGLQCFSSPFDDTAVDFLESINVPAYKVASFELIDVPLLERIGRTGKPVIVSTGMASLEEIELAVATLRDAGARQIALLKCTSAYPSKPSEMNLKTIGDMATRFSVPVGLSDHTLGIAVPVCAVALGASIVEKHLTMERTAGGPDSAFSLEPAEFRQMVDAIRVAEQSLGQVTYGGAESEKACKPFRRSLFVVRDVAAGEVLTREHVRSIRPGDGLEPKHLEAVIGRRAASDLPRGTPLEWKHVA